MTNIVNSIYQATIMIIFYKAFITVHRSYLRMTNIVDSIRFHNALMTVYFQRVTDCFIELTKEVLKYCLSMPH